MSPGKFTKKYAAKQLKHRLQAEERSKLPSTKRRRIQLKQERNNTQCAFQALEGDTYQSGMFYFKLYIVFIKPEVYQLPFLSH